MEARVFQVVYRLRKDILDRHSGNLVRKFHSNKLQVNVEYIVPIQM